MPLDVPPPQHPSRSSSGTPSLPPRPFNLPPRPLGPDRPADSPGSTSSTVSQTVPQDFSPSSPGTPTLPPRPFSLPPRPPSPNIIHSSVDSAPSPTIPIVPPRPAIVALQSPTDPDDVPPQLSFEDREPSEAELRIDYENQEIERFMTLFSSVSSSFALTHA
jgi:hypothetical protein